MPVHIGFQRRFDAGYVAARDGGRVRRARLGAHACAPGPSTRPRRTPEYIAASGGFFRDCSVHDFDSVRWVSGHEVVEVYATGANRGETFFAEAGDVDTGAALLTLDDGTLALVSRDAATTAPATTSGSRCSGSQDSIAVGLDDRLPLRSAEPGVDLPRRRPVPGLHGPVPAAPTSPS